MALVEARAGHHPDEHRLFVGCRAANGDRDLRRQMAGGDQRALRDDFEVLLEKVVEQRFGPGRLHVGDGALPQGEALDLERGAGAGRDVVVQENRIRAGVAAPRGDARLEVAALVQRGDEPIAILLPAIEIEAIAGLDAQHPAQIARDRGGRTTDLDAADARHWRTRRPAGLARRSAATKRHLVPELVRPAVVVVGRRAQVDAARRPIRQNPGDVAGLTQVLRHDELDLAAEVLRDRQPGIGIRFRGEQIERGRRGAEALTDANRIESDTLPRRPENFSRQEHQQLTLGDVGIGDGRVVGELARQEERDGILLAEPGTAQADIQRVRSARDFERDVVLLNARLEREIQDRLDLGRVREGDGAAAHSYVRPPRNTRPPSPRLSRPASTGLARVPATVSWLASSSRP